MRIDRAGWAKLGRLETAVKQIRRRMLAVEPEIAEICLLHAETIAKFLDEKGHLPEDFPRVADGTAAEVVAAIHSWAVVRGSREAFADYP